MEATRATPYPRPWEEGGQRLAPMADGRRQKAIGSGGASRTGLKAHGKRAQMQNV